jgi:hypothetical protein
MLNLCGIVAAILKMATDIEKFLEVAIFKMATKIKHCPISSKFDMWVDNDVPTLTVAIFKMAATIPHKFNIPF